MICPQRYIQSGKKSKEQPMKIGVVGKGGVGKTSVSSLLSRVLSERGRRVIAVDTDSNPNLGLSLGLTVEETESQIPIPRSLVVGHRGDLSVKELIDTYATSTPTGPMLMSALRVTQAGAGCTCGGHASVRSMLGSTIEEIADDTIIDMEAGIEHLSRSGGTLAHVDVLVLVFEASRKAVVTASRTIALARELGIPGWIGVANKVEPSEEATVRTLCAEHDVPLDVIIRRSDAIVEADHAGVPMSRNAAPELWDKISSLADRLAAGASADSR